MFSILVVSNEQNYCTAILSIRVCLQETVGVFLSHPSVKDEPDLEGRTAFMWAAGKGSDDVIRTMLSLTPHIDINMADKYGGTGEPLRNRRGD